MQSSQTAVQPLLVELLTEELPPRALESLGKAFEQGIREGLAQHQLLAEGCQSTGFATPRRLAVLLDAVRAQAPDQAFTEKLMPARIGLAESGDMTPALARRLEAKGLAHLQVADLVIESDGRQDFIFARGTAAGARLTEGLQTVLETTIAQLPIPKVMHYSRNGGPLLRFVRPAHSLVALWGSQVLEVHALGLAAGRHTKGHRFMGQADLTLEQASQYEGLLREKGQVIASFGERRALIAAQLGQQAETLGASLGEGPETTRLLDEVTALVEHPSVYVGEFEADFLEVPPECLTLTMRLNQKYFPLFNPRTGKLENRFLIVSNMAVSDPANIIEGNQRVIRPRLADARFFYDTDRRIPLAERVETLKASIYHHRLGSQLERVERIRACAEYLAQALGASPRQAQRAAWLAKADLGTAMVGEFPELQGIMGAYYAQHDGEDPAVVQAIRGQYQLRISQPVEPASLVPAILFMAERLETLTGIWGIGLQPTGERDPFGLRRAALGIISAFEQLTLGGQLNVAQTTAALDLDALLEFTASLFAPGLIADNTPAQLSEYIYERYRHQLAQTHERGVIDAVLTVRPPLHQVSARIDACEAFAKAPQAAALAAANKRVSNILRRNEQAIPAVNPRLFQESAEQALAQRIQALEPQARAALNDGDFAQAMAVLAQAGPAVDTFFDEVMIMAHDPAIRGNRLALLQELHGLMNQVADISRLAS